MRHSYRAPARRPVIALVGIDGSGKTTQARRLAGWLTSRGVPAAYWQNAGGRRWLDRRARRLGRPDARAALGVTAVLVVESVLRWLAIARALLWSWLTGRAAVMDRYTVCQYASIRAHGGRPGRLVRAAYRRFRPPDLMFLLVVPPAEAYRRIEARGTDHERLAFLTAAAVAYDALSRADGLVRVDADAPPDRVFRALTTHLEAHLDLGTGYAGAPAGGTD
jgi:dTMP kinase